ncbi:SsgA family sporulation/cell division regulator [Wenjunlia tyrosinilytica]|uniref:Sporulation-specific cell division protein SsgB n=1 Tax=Wenjunlia tyrosinilytica TaxID=1544741 RepID=A0A917ZLR3_9ACTN|nr:SsgA family sporulation/cell division regulator [Wenjunlia tyrosinilytica]GGO85398.1 sporulation-specific cell division protein SsgB [Wenjunlia tyrosinilytica]
MTAVRQTIEFDVVTAPELSLPITAELFYLSADPFAVHIRFPGSATLSGREVEWAFARDLLGAGLGTPTGLGDIRIWPLEPGRTALALIAPEGVAVLEGASADLFRFLDRTYAAVPAGSERDHSGVDRALASLLAGEE